MTELSDLIGMPGLRRDGSTAEGSQEARLVLISVNYTMSVSETLLFLGIVCSYFF